MFSKSWLPFNNVSPFLESPWWKNFPLNHGRRSTMVFWNHLAAQGRVRWISLFAFSLRCPQAGKIDDSCPPLFFHLLKNWWPALLCFSTFYHLLILLCKFVPVEKKSISIWHAGDLMEFCRYHFTSNGYNQNTEDVIALLAARGKGDKFLFAWKQPFLGETGLDFRRMAWQRRLSAIKLLSSGVNFFYPACPLGQDPEETPN